MSDDPTLASRSARALGWSWAGALVRALLQLVVQIALARLLGPEAFGQAAAALLVLGLAALLAEGGLAAALVQRPQLGVHDLAIAAGWVLVMSLVVAAIVALAALPIARLLGDARLAAFIVASAAIVPLQALSALPAALLQRQFRIKRLQAIQLLAYVIGYAGLGLALAAAGAGAWSLLAAFALHALVVTVAALAGSGMSWRPRLSGGGALRGYGARTTAANLVNWGLESIDRLLVSRVWGSAALGAYTLAATLARAPVTLLVSSAQPVAFAAAARLQDQDERLARGYLAVVSLALLVAVPLFAFLAWFAGPVVALLYGPQWGAAAQPFAWLCVGVPFFVMLALTGPMLRGVDAVGHEMRAQLGVLVLMALMLAAAAATGQPVVVVAAIVALASAMRAAALAWALSRRIGLPLASPWQAWRGGLVLGLQVLVIAALSSSLIADEQTAALATALLAPLLALVSLRWRGEQLLGAELCLALANRRGDSRGAAALCAWAGLE